MDGHYQSEVTAAAAKWTLGECTEGNPCAVCRGVALWSLTNKTLRGALLERFYCWGCLLKVVGLRTLVR